eukprot:3947993-Amphidinium_carterae.1
MQEVALSRQKHRNHKTMRGGGSKSDLIQLREKTFHAASPGSSTKHALAAPALRGKEDTEKYDGCIR